VGADTVHPMLGQTDAPDDTAGAAGLTWTNLET
jgi:hypothetical protein